MQKLAANLYEVPSQSTPGVTYRVFQDREGIWKCTCKGYEHRATCKHVTLVQDERQKEQARNQRDTALLGRASQRTQNMVSFLRSGEKGEGYGPRRRDDAEPLSRSLHAPTFSQRD